MNPTKVAEALVKKLEEGDTILEALRKESESSFFRDFAIHRLASTLKDVKAFLSNPQNYMTRIGFLEGTLPVGVPDEDREPPKPETTPARKRTAKRWTPAEDKELIAWMSDPEVSAKETAAALNRTVPAVKNRWAQLKKNATPVK